MFAFFSSSLLQETCEYCFIDDFLFCFVLFVCCCFLFVFSFFFFHCLLGVTQCVLYSALNVLAVCFLTLVSSWCYDYCT